MEPHDGINASTFYGRGYKDLESAIGDLKDDDRQIDLTIIPSSPDYETDSDEIDEDNRQSDDLPADVPSKIEVFTNNSKYDSDDNIPLARYTHNLTEYKYNQEKHCKLGANLRVKRIRHLMEGDEELNKIFDWRQQ
ncbi:hypothetical protein FQA39_LY10421 [Lamprigera yunnana]|nr:hypothetical protein FQA39_LY10421 [Lamprigera yunnana]